MNLPSKPRKNLNQQPSFHVGRRRKPTKRATKKGTKVKRVWRGKGRIEALSYSRTIPRSPKKHVSPSFNVAPSSSSSRLVGDDRPRPVICPIRRMVGWEASFKGGRGGADSQAGRGASTQWEGGRDEGGTKEEKDLGDLRCRLGRGGGGKV